MIRRPPRSTQGVSSAASDVYKRQEEEEKEEEETKACAVKGEISLKEFSSLNEAEEYEWTTKTTGGEEEAKAIVKTWFTRPVLEKMFAETLETFVEKMNEFCAE